MSEAITPEIVRKAWELRQRGLWTMREIAEQLGVNREALIDAMKEMQRLDDKEV